MAKGRVPEGERGRKLAGLALEGAEGEAADDVLLHEQRQQEDGQRDTVAAAVRPPQLISS